MKLTVLIPVYNEEATVAELIKKVKDVRINKVRKEILVINDGSTDKTNQILSKIRGIKIITHNKNKGKGSAVRTGLKKATGDMLIIQDADLEYNPKDFKKLIDPILKGKSEVVYGTRLKNYPLILFGENKTPLPQNLIANKALTLFTNILYGSNLTDMETCYKVFSKKVYKDLNLVSKGFEIEPEITAKILLKKIKIVEVPIKVKPRGYEEGKKISWKDGFIAIYTLLKYRFT